MIGVVLPKPPDWQIDWPRLLEHYEPLARLRGVPQEPRNHGEGDALAHTQLTCEELVRSERWLALDDAERQIVFLAALLHDAGKAATTREEPDGRITSRGHSRRGVRIARRMLWEADVPFEVREAAVNLIRYHQVPYWILERDAPERLTRQISQSVRCDMLCALVAADARGRIAQDRDRLIEGVDLFEELARSLDCLGRPARFASDHGRFLYFRGNWAAADVAPHEAFSCEVLVMSGLPGAGKDHWIRELAGALPVVSLDDIREELGVDPSEEQGRVVQRAREAARQHLRRGESFVWNATNVSRRLRAYVVDLATSYRARAQIVYVEAAYERVIAQNRKHSRPVPSDVLDALIDRRWDVPDPWEAQEVRYVFS